MLSGIGFTELLLLFVIGLLILGPERLPRVAAQLGRWIGKARRTANQLRFQMEREIALADIERARKDRKPDAPQGDKPGSTGGSEQSDNESSGGQGPQADAAAANGSADPAGTGSASPEAGSAEGATTGAAASAAESASIAESTTER